MCRLCENKTSIAKINDGWLCIDWDNGGARFPVHYCPWCAKKIKEERMMPKVTPKYWKYEMQEQEAENETGN